ncbi:beclin 1-associated autophagy-related key regulator isoform X3 [Planococcus citri]|uniref:beclin 1-associated autophagy-related key regulator isoform X3 n=1 Tax=Planococcus citri TaxID=170843 RepID=UPI0031F95C8D
MDSFNFDFSLLNIDTNLKTSLGENVRFSRPMEQCQLCNKLRKTFYCKTCIKNGDFIHSTSRFSERFAEKRLALLRAQNEKNELNKEYEKHLTKIRTRENIFEQIREKKEKIAILQSLSVEKKKTIKRRKKMLEDLKSFNERSGEELLKNEDCHLELKENMTKLGTQQPLILSKLEIIRPSLKALIRTRIEELVQFIFPINEVQSSKSVSQNTDSQEDIKNKLAEAQRTAYIRGRWVFTDSWGETQHSIVAPTLPDSGDYSPYLDWVSADKDNTLAMTSSSDVDHNPAYNLSAALTYTTQLVNIIAYYLDIRLPNKLYYRQEITDIDTSCISYYEGQLTHQIRTVATRLSISDVEDDDRDALRMDNMVIDDNYDDEYDSDHLSTDWEAVPLVSCPEAQPGSNVNRKHIISTAQTSSIAGGLVNSAAASLASIWRGWSANK